MSNTEIESVLENWIGQSLSPSGKIAEGLSPAGFVAKNFLLWWSGRVEETLDELESAIRNARNELSGHGGWQTFGEAMDELSRSQEAVGDLRQLLGTDK